jgi:hypothetical protein
MKNTITRDVIDKAIENNSATANNVFCWKPFEGRLKHIRIDATIEDFFLIYDLKNDKHKLSLADMNILTIFLRDNSGKFFIVTEKNYMDIIDTINIHIRNQAWQ